MRPAFISEADYPEGGLTLHTMEARFSFSQERLFFLPSPENVADCKHICGLKLNPPRPLEDPSGGEAYPGFTSIALIVKLNISEHS